MAGNQVMFKYAIFHQGALVFESNFKKFDLLLVSVSRSAELQDLNQRNFAGQRTCAIKHKIVKPTQFKIKA